MSVKERANNDTRTLSDIKILIKDHLSRDLDLTKCYGNQLPVNMFVIFIDPELIRTKNNKRTFRRPLHVKNTGTTVRTIKELDNYYYVTIYHLLHNCSWENTPFVIDKLF